MSIHRLFRFKTTFLSLLILVPTTFLEAQEVSCFDLFNHKTTPVYSESIAVKLGLKQMLGIDDQKDYPTFSNQMPFTPTTKSAHDFFDRPIYKFRAQIDSHDIIGNAAQKKLSLQLFKSDFQVVPIQFFDRRLDIALGIPGDTNMLLMQLPKLEMTQMPEVSGSHINAFAFLRFNIRDGNIFVTEIQNDYFAKFDKENKDKYQSWPRILMYTFETYAKNLVSQGVLPATARIIMTNEVYQKQRWPQVDDLIIHKGIGNDLARMLYRDLPKWLGYTPSSETFKGFDWVGHIDEHDRNVIPIEEPWTSHVSALPLTPLKSNFNEHLKVSLENNFDRVFDKALIPAPFTPKILDANKAEISISAPSLAKTILSRSSEAMKQTYAQVMDYVNTQTNGNLTQFTNQSTFPNFDFKIGDSINFNTTTYTISPAKMRTLDIDDSNSNLVLSIKGSGIFQNDLDVKNFTFVNQETFKNTLIPFREQESEGQTPRASSHQYFGALSMHDAFLEFKNALELHRVYILAYGHLAPALLPVQISRLDAIPVFENDKTTLYSQAEYNGKFFKNPDVELVQYNYFSHSQIRISELRDLITQKEGIDTKTVNHYLVKLYESFNHKVILPSSPDTLDQPQLLKYLHQVYLLNKLAADDALKTFYNNSLTVMGLVHGLGGNLGGVAEMFVETPEGTLPLLDDPVGAANGGSMAARNINIYGEIFDLDNNVYFPWAEHKEHHFAMKYVEKEMQKYDLELWNRSAYFIEMFLKGRTDIDQPYIDEEFMGSPNYRFAIMSIPVEFDYKKEWSRAPINLEFKKSKWNNLDLEKTYLNAVLKGKSIK